tara:strand:+ start:420 stop:914 length:495 start_codon:yes stop_codon:yes gene_type:complete
MNLGRTGRSAGLFIVMLALLEGLYLLSDQSEAVAFFAKTTAHLTAMALTVLGEAVRVDGVSLYSPLLNMRIVSECTAITPTMVFAAAVLAFPSSVSVKLKGLVLGIVALYLINLVRVVSLYYIGTHAPSQMEFAHIVVWQSVMVLMAIGLWSLWAARYSELRSA